MLTRRRFLIGAAGAGALGAVGSMTGLPKLVEARRRRLPEPDDSGIEHVIVLMMENRSFDHYLGWLPGADGRQAGLSYLDRDGVPHETHALAPDYQGCGHADPDQSYEAGRVEYNEGKCDGWLKAGRNDVYAIGYYTDEDLPFTSEAALAWTTFDRYFAAFMGPTRPNRIYQHAGVTDRIRMTPEISVLPTIWDRLADAGLDGRYYFSRGNVLRLWGDKYAGIARSYQQFLADCASGDLPQVSFVDPRFGGPDGTQGDDHPHADIRHGQSFLNQTYGAVTSSAAWPSTVFIINYDEWGGFFDHVPPPEAPDVKPEYELRGFRVPVLLMSPFARRGHIAHEVYDHTSILRMIEWRWDLEPLSIRDALANNIAEELSFSEPDASAPQFDVPEFPPGPACGAAVG